jgi:hypothetical protein
MAKKRSTTGESKGKQGMDVPPDEGIEIDLHRTFKIGLICVSALLFIYDVFYLLPDENPTALDRIKTIALFVLMSYGIGYTALSFVRKIEDPFERLFMTFGMGFSIVPILTLILSTLRIPLDATLLLAISLIYPAYAMLKKGNETATGKQTFKELLENKNTLSILIVVLLASIYLFVLLKGALNSPYLEDDDSWDHAVGAKYISVVKDYSLPKEVTVTHYLEPYPPTYDGIMGILHQYNTSLQWTLKFFNALLVGISIITAYYFIRLFTGDDRIALGGAFILTVVPCYLSHFIWAHTLGHVLFYPALYATEMANKDKKWAIIAMLAVASAVVAQPIVTVVFGLFYILYYITRAVFERKLLKQIFIIGLVGLLLAIVFFWGQMVLKYGTGFEKIDNAGNLIKSGEFKLAMDKETVPLETIALVQSFEGKQPDDCATLIPGKYCIPLTGHISLQMGFGVVLLLLFIVSVILLIVRYRTETQGNAYWIPVCIVWAVFTAVGLESWALPVSLDPTRFFMFMTLPVAILTSKGTLMLMDLLKKHVKPTHFLILIFIAVLYTSAYPKYIVQTAMWPYGVMWNGLEHIQGYAALKKLLPPEAKAFPMCTSDSAVIGMDKLSYAWDEEVLDFRKTILDRNASEIYSFLKSKGYEYAILDVSCIVKCDVNKNQTNACVDKVNKIAEDIGKSGKYTLTWSNNAVLIYKLK